MRSRLALALLVATAAGCDDGRGSPATAKGDTTVRFVICGAGDRDCLVSARFGNFESCEEYKKFANMLCNSRTPGRMTCQAPDPPSLVTSYCTK
jgi:hypothetical protein